MARHRLPNQLREVRTQSDAQVECSTAEKWAGRAVACYRMYASSGKVTWLIRADRYREEALEHAAVVGDCGKTVMAIQKEIDRQARSFGIVDGKPVESRRRPGRRRGTKRRRR